MPRWRPRSISPRVSPAILKVARVRQDVGETLPGRYNADPAEPTRPKDGSAT